MQIALIHQACDLCGADHAVDLGPVAIGEACRSLAQECAVRLEQVRVVACAECGFFYADPMPVFDHHGMQQLYGADYFGEYTQRWRRRRTLADPERRLDAIQRASEGQVRRFLEIGCGEGFALERAALRGWEVVGQEVSEAFGSRLRRRLSCEVFVGTLEQAPWPSGSFDAVYMDSVIEHVSRPMGMLRQISFLLRPGGVLYLICPNESCLLNAVRSLARRLGLRQRAAQLSPLANPYHVVGFTRATLARALRRAGLRPVEVAVRFGSEELGKFVPRSRPERLRQLALHPLYVLGERLGRGTTLEAIAVRQPAVATTPS